MLTKTPEPDIDKSKFRDSQHRYITQSLFKETASNPEFVIYTLKEDDYTMPDGRVLPSIKKLYLDFNDPTEYLFATTCFATWPHWKRIAKNKQLTPYIEEWRAELAYKIRAIGLREIILRAQTDTSSTAARFLATEGWKPNRKAGAPTKAEKQGHLRDEQRIEDELDKDFERVKPLLPEILSD